MVRKLPYHIPRTTPLTVYRRLFRYYGPQSWWPAETRWEMMVGAILVQNTAWTNAEKAILALKKSKALSAKAIARMPRGRLEKLIRSSGYFRQKAERLQLFSRALLVEPAIFRSRERLLSQHGIGPETADAILLYAGGHPTFVVDAYTRRIGRRIGLFRTEDYHKVQAYFHDRLPKDAELYNEYHALLVRHAKELCTSRHPKCSGCPIRQDCAYGRRRVI